MSDKHRAFGDIDEAKQKEYEREARLQYDPNLVKESHQNWNSYTKSQQDFIKEQGNQIYTDIAEQIDAGKRAEDAISMNQHWNYWLD